ncbi:hybrid sensor histidine kinase/response regulator, partial [Vibrio aquaticus]
MKFSLPSLFTTETSSTNKPSDFKNNVLDTLSDGIVICDGIDDSHSMFYVNPAFVSFYQSDHKSLIGQKFLEFFHHRLSEQHYSKLCKTIRTKSAAYIEIAVESDGIDKTIRLHVEPM